jgi:hypothetical protein
MLPSLAIVVIARAAVNLAPVVYPADRPPGEVGRHIEQLTTRRGAAQDEAADRLARLPAAEPYLRPLLAAPDPTTRRQAGRALSALRDQACERALDRHAAGWARAGRVDMLVELACLTQDGKLAGRVADLVLTATAKLSPNMTAPPPLGQEKMLRFPVGSYAVWSRTPGFLRVSDGELMTGSNAGNVFAHSLTFKTDVGSDKSYWLCLIGDRLTETTPRLRDWWQSIITVNNAAKFEELHAAIVVIDGDIDLESRFGHSKLDGSVIICRGSIRAKPRITVSRSLLVAGGDIVLPTGPDRTVLLYAGGRVALANLAGKPTVKEGADVSFTGIRFFELADVGVDAAADKGGVRITKLDPRSPLAFYGLRVGDVVTKLNDQPTPTVHEFRRQVRRSVVLRAGIFSVRRGGEGLSCIAYFDGLLNPRK